MHSVHADILESPSQRPRFLDKDTKFSRHFDGQPRLADNLFAVNREYWPKYFRTIASLAAGEYLMQRAQQAKKNSTPKPNPMLQFHSGETG